MAEPIEFHGNDEERMALLVALEHNTANCACREEADGRKTTCPAHAMLHDQRVLDGLLFARHIEMQLVIEESSPARWQE